MALREQNIDKSHYFKEKWGKMLKKKDKKTSKNEVYQLLHA